MADFLSNLRMNGVFGGSQPFGMPDLSAGNINLDALQQTLNTVAPAIEQSKQNDFNRQRQMFEMQRQAHLEDIGRQIQAQTGFGPHQLNPFPGGTPQQQQPNVIYKPPASDTAAALAKPESDYQKAEIDLGKAKLAQAGQTAQGKQNIAEDKQKLAAQDSATRQQRANVYEFKAKHPNVQVIIPKGGNIQYYDPATKETVDSGVDSGTMSDEDKITLQGEQRQELEGTRQAGREKIQGMRGQQQLEDIGARVAGKTTGVTKPELPTQTRVRQANAAREIVNTRPDLAKFITTNPDGSFNVMPPGGTSFFGPTGPTQEQYDAIKGIIYGAQTPTTNVETPTETPKKATTTSKTVKPAASKYKVTVE